MQIRQIYKNKNAMIYAKTNFKISPNLRRDSCFRAKINSLKYRWHLKYHSYLKYRDRKLLKTKRGFFKSRFISLYDGEFLLL